MRRLLVLSVLMLSSAAYAHKPSDSYVSLKISEKAIVGQWDVALRDLDYVLGLDANQDGAITWGEVKAKHNEINAYVFGRLSLKGTEVCPIRPGEHLIDHHSDGAYAVLKFVATCPRPVTTLDIGYSLLFDVDPQHKGLFQINAQNTNRTAIFDNEMRQKHFVLSETSWWREFFDYGREGIWHIWVGLDHILFLLSLLLPAVLYRTSHHWQGVERFKPAFWEVFKVVTAFTVAHSITLSLAALSVISLPTRLTESAIALSVVLAALNNIFPVVEKGRWLVAFGFGLIHGFGFASVLTDLGLPQNTLILALVGFNLGVETGQLALVVLFFPLAFGLRHTGLYQRVIMVGGSMAILVLAVIWFVQRAFNMKLINF